VKQGGHGNRNRGTSACAWGARSQYFAAESHSERVERFASGGRRARLLFAAFERAEGGTRTARARFAIIVKRHVAVRAPPPTPITTTTFPPVYGAWRSAAQAWSAPMSSRMDVVGSPVVGRGRRVDGGWLGYRGHSPLSCRGGTSSVRAPSHRDTAPAATVHCTSPDDSPRARQSSRHQHPITPLTNRALGKQRS